MLINGEPRSPAERRPVRSSACTSSTPRTRGSSTSPSRGARAKLVGGDSGRYERETFVDEVLLAPSERAVLDVLFDTPGTVRLEHRTPERYVRPRRVHRHRRIASKVRRRPSRPCASTPSSRPCIRRSSRPRPAAGQGAGVLLEDAAALRRRRGRFLRLSDASGGDVHRARDVSEVRHEAHRCRTSGTDVLRLPDASRGHRDRAGDLSRVRDEARARRKRPLRPPPRTRWSTATTTTATASSGRT